MVSLQKMTENYALCQDQNFTTQKRIWSHLLKKSLMANFISCAVFTP